MSSRSTNCAESLTRIEVNIDVDPGSLLEKAARGMRHIKRAVRADIARYKAFIEMQELETGAWRGVIEDGEVVETTTTATTRGATTPSVEDIYEEAGPTDDDDEEDDEDGVEDPAARGSRSGSSNGRAPKTSRLEVRASRSKSGTRLVQAELVALQVELVAPRASRRLVVRPPQDVAAAGADHVGSAQERSREARRRRQAVAGCTPRSRRSWPRPRPPR